MNRITKAFTWKFLERAGVLGVQFVIQIVLARLLSPDHYGVLSLMLIFITIANVFVQQGFSTSLIQNKDVTEEDYSSVFWVSLGISGVLYGIIYLTAPLIGSFYSMPDIVKPLRVVGLILMPGAFNSVQLARLSRELDFKNIFLSNLGGILISGIVGIVMAYMGAGLWALVMQYLLNIVFACIVMIFTVRWLPRLVINWSRVKILFSFGWKILVSTLIDTIFQDIRSMVIGKKYDESSLGFYNRGKQFPQFVISIINSSVQSVVLPLMSEKQNNVNHLKSFTRSSIQISSYVIFPMMAGLAAVADSVVTIMLTDKWLPCVPYMRIYCFTLAFWPVHTSNLQAINAIGRSDIYLKIEIIKKIIGVIALAIALIIFDSPIAIAMTGIITTLISCFINAYPNKKLIFYSYTEQMKDIFPSLISSVFMCIIVVLVGKIEMNIFISLILQVVIGVVIYIFVSAVFHLKPFLLLMELVKKFAR